MGPEASAALYLRLIKRYQAEGAYKDADFPEIILYNLPLPDVVEEVDDRARDALIEGVKLLEASGATFIAIPCNTVSTYMNELRSAVSIPILNIVEETAKRIQGKKKIGIIGTAMTVSENLYGKALTQEVIYPTKEEQERITKIIITILKGTKKEKERNLLREIASRMRKEGAQEILLGCTELPLILDEGIDTIQVLAEATFRVATEKK
jgi:aspartate racemase